MKINVIEMIRPRSALLTLYGDYVRSRGTEIGIGSLIRLLANFDISEQSVRSAVSRMCRVGLLKVRHNGARNYYSLTSDGLALLEAGERRIFQRKSTSWNGFWSVIVYYIPEEKREVRDRLRQELVWMGCGPLSTATWVSPHDLHAEVEELVRKLNLGKYVQMFRARQLGFGRPEDIISRCWDLERIHHGYAVFIEAHRARMNDHIARLEKGEDIEPCEFFAERFMLIHEYRRLPFFDPDLPEELLPDNWLRSQASDMFHTYHDMLADKANSYFDSVLKAY